MKNIEYKIHDLDKYMYEAVRKLLTNNLYVSGFYAHGDFLELLNSKENTEFICICVAYNNNIPIGWVSCKNNGLLAIYVKPSYRRNGIGKRLIHMCRKFAIDYCNDFTACLGIEGSDIFWKSVNIDITKYCSMPDDNENKKSDNMNLIISKCNRCPFALVPPGKGPVECGLCPPDDDGGNERPIITVPFQNGAAPPSFCPLRKKDVIMSLAKENKKVPRVHNKHHNTAPEDAVYIGRGSSFGNPFIIGQHGDRDEVCDKFEVFLLANPDLTKKVKRELKGKDLVCFCAPKRCHGDILLKVANPNG